MRWARDLGRIYTLAAGSFLIVLFAEGLLLILFMPASAEGALCASILWMLLVGGAFLIYFGLEKYDGFFDTLTKPLPFYLHPYYRQFFNYYYPYYYQHYQYYQPYYPHPQSPPQTQHMYYQTWYIGPGAQALPPGQPPYQYPPPAPAPTLAQPPYPEQGPTPQMPRWQPDHHLPRLGPEHDNPWGMAPQTPVSPQYRTGALAEPFRTLQLPPASLLMLAFLTAVLVGGVSLALWNEAPGATILVFPLAFIIGFSFPSLIWISYFYEFDREPAPARAVLLALTAGMVSTIPALYINSLAAVALGGEAASALSVLVVAALVAPFVEELCKPLGIYIVRDRVRRRLDGLIYGVTAGVGFAMIENITYELSFLFTGDDPATVWSLGSLARGLGSIVVHAVGAGAIGYAYGRYRTDGGPAIWGLPSAYLLAVGLHSAWNGTATLLEGAEWGWLAIVPFMAAFALGGFLLMRKLVDRALASERPQAPSWWLSVQR
ncbi:MAG: PrsW family intramembrane metalloprotease [Thermoplasmatota archaeon]